MELQGENIDLARSGEYSLKHLASVSGVVEMRSHVSSSKLPPQNKVPSKLIKEMDESSR